jgi:peptide/nickel transport system permease protein
MAFWIHGFVIADVALIEEVVQLKRRRLKRFWRKKNAVIGATIVILVCFIAVFAPLLSPHHYADGNLNTALLGVGEDSRYPLGTDHCGRDMLSRLLFGARISLLVGLIAQLANTIIGGTLGILGGFYGGICDDVITFVTNVTLSLPVLIFALALMALLGPGLQNLFIALGITNWCGTCRLARSKTLSVREENYVEAAQAAGCSTFRILFKHILPNSIMPIIVIGTLGIGDAILIAASLGFLGLGAQPPLPEWGTMLSVGRNYIFSAPWLSILPGVAILITVLGFNLLGDGLRDLIDPHTKLLKK